MTVGGLAAKVLFSGLTPGLVGVYQINIQVPQNASSGDQEVVVSFPPYQVCCTGGGAVTTTTVYVNSTPVKLPVGSSAANASPSTIRGGCYNIM